MFRTGDGDGTATTRSQSSRLWTLWLAARVETLYGPGSGPSGAVPRLKLCQMTPILSPHSILAMLPAAMAKSAIHTIVRFKVTKMPHKVTSLPRQSQGIYE